MHKPKIRQLPVAVLIVDPNVQRPLDRGRAAKIASNLDMNAIGVVTVSQRSNGAYHVIDGQHRVEAVRLASVEEEKVQCRIFEGLTVEDEAKLFRLLNNTTKLGALDKFRVRVVEGEPVAVAINDTLSRAGWKVVLSSHEGAFSAVAAAERVFDRDPEALARTIGVLTIAWGLNPAGVDGRIFEGVGLVFARFGETVDAANLAERLRRYPGGPGSLIGKALGLREMLGSTVPNSVAEIVIQTYNRGRKTRALPEWRS